MAFFRHPSKRALREWLDGAAAPSVESHVDSCQRCAGVLEELDTPVDLSIGDALALVYTPPVNLSDRLEQRVVARLDSRVMLGVVSDLFGAGVETSKLLLMEEPEDE